MEWEFGSEVYWVGTTRTLDKGLSHSQPAYRQIHKLAKFQHICTQVDFDHGKEFGLNGPFICCMYWRLRVILLV
jgi:hypothetical protein